MHSYVAAMAERTKVLLVEHKALHIDKCQTIFNRPHVMHFRGNTEDAFLHAVLAKRMTSQDDTS